MRSPLTLSLARCLTSCVITGMCVALHFSVCTLCTVYVWCSVISCYEWQMCWGEERDVANRGNSHWIILTSCGLFSDRLIKSEIHLMSFYQIL